MFGTKLTFRARMSSFYLLQLFHEVPLLPAMTFFYDPNFSLILLLIKENMSHIMSVCAKTTQHTCDIVSDWPCNFTLAKRNDNFRHFDSHMSSFGNGLE